MDGSHHDTYTWLFVILLIIGGAGSYLALTPAGEFVSNTSTTEIQDTSYDTTSDRTSTEVDEANEESGLSWKSLFPKGNILRGDKVVTIDEVAVRRAPGGGILGMQDKRERATVIGGPEEALGTTWWELDFENAPDGWVDGKDISAYVFLYLLFNIIPILYENVRWIAVLLTIILLCALIYVLIKHSNLKKRVLEKKSIKYSIEEQKNIAKIEAKPLVNKKWQHVQGLMESQNNNDWRQAIIEADIMLDEMLTKIGYAGESIGERLKNVEESDFTTLNSAWEAHKVRNRIAHKGSDFAISHSEAKRIIGLYEDVFREFYYI